MVQLIIESIKQEDPANKNIPSLESKLSRIIKSIERKTGRDLGGGSGTVQASAPQALPDKPEVKEVSQSPSASQPAAKAVSQTPSASQPVAKVVSQSSASLIHQTNSLMKSGSFSKRPRLMSNRPKAKPKCSASPSMPK